MVSVLPDTTEQVSRVVKYCFEQASRCAARRRYLTVGGALPLADGVLLGLASSSASARSISTTPWWCRAGLTNLASARPWAHAVLYAPDPSSQIACSIGGMSRKLAACIGLKYGMDHK